MRMRVKLTLILLFASLVSAGTVGGVAYWMLMRDFNKGVLDEAFENFQADVRVYLSEYGGWENAVRHESFHHFATQRHFEAAAGLPRPGGIDRRNQPPYRFLLLNPRGRVLRGLADYPEGSFAPASVRNEARPIEYGGKVVLLAAPVGAPMLTPGDLSYLAAMRQALLTGIGMAVLLAVVIGLVAGQRLSEALGALVNAIRAMQADRETEVHVPVRGRDELSEVATAFNRMSTELSRAHRELRESSELVQAQAEQVRELSIRDPLTNVYNRRHFDEQAGVVYQQAVRYRHPLSLMIGDIDHFKKINDNFSHALGDEVLRRVAELLVEGTRSSDIVARYGGEEFVVLFPETGLEQASLRCEALRCRIEAHPWHELHPELRVTMSIGLSDDVAAGSVEEMLARADERLYDAKEGGRNKVLPEAVVA
jgi:two-component system cell cycle response regulator